jgi:hypothetical protein
MSGIMTMLEDEDAAELFWRKVVSGAELKEGEASQALRDYFLRNEHVSTDIKVRDNETNEIKLLFKDEKGPGGAKQRRLLYACFFAWKHFLTNSRTRLSYRDLSKQVVAFDRAQLAQQLAQKQPFHWQAIPARRTKAGTKSKKAAPPPMFHPLQEGVLDRASVIKLGMVKWVLYNRGAIAPDLTQTEIAILFGEHANLISAISTGAKFGEIAPLQPEPAKIASLRQILVDHRKRARALV